MIYIVNVLKEFDGLIGAILGSIFATVATLLTTHILSTKGKTLVYPLSLETKFFKRDQYGGSYGNNDNPLEADYGNILCKLQFYNSSDIPKAIRNIKISINGKRIVKQIPDDESTRRFVAASHTRDKLNSLNLPPKQIIEKELFVFISNNDVSIFNDPISIYFEAEYHDGKKINVRIK